MLFSIALFFGGAFFANSIPHLTNGTSGRRFPTPFSRPFGRGESPSWVNVIWGALNLFLGYLLVFTLGAPETSLWRALITAGVGGLLFSLYNSWAFGRIYEMPRGDIQ